jgi:hypothetical protein
MGLESEDQHGLDFLLIYIRTIIWIFLYLIYHDFREINGRTKIFDKCTSGATALRVPTTVGHGIRGHANGRQYRPVGSGIWRRGQWRQDPWRRGPRR